MASTHMHENTHTVMHTNTHICFTNEGPGTVEQAYALVAEAALVGEQ